MGEIILLKNVPNPKENLEPVLLFYKDNKNK